LSLNASPSGTASYGTPITLTATLSNLDSGSPLYPTGTVTFYNNGTSIGTGTLTQVGSGNTSTYALVLSGSNSLAGGSDSLTVAYGGDSNFTAVTDTSTPVSYTVSPATSGSGGATVTTTVTSSLNPSVYGDLVTLSVNVAGTGAMPTGTVTITDTTTSTTLGTPTLDGSGNATITVTAADFTAGAHSIRVTYSGDGNYSSSYSTPASAPPTDGGADASPPRGGNWALGTHFSSRHSAAPSWRSAPAMPFHRVTPPINKSSNRRCRL